MLTLLHHSLILSTILPSAHQLATHRHFCTPSFGKNLVSATLLPNIIEKELLSETDSGRMSGPFFVEEAHVIFNGHFWTSPMGLVEKVLGDGNWRMIRHLSKTDHLGFSTNDTLDSNDFPTLFFSAAHVAELVCISYFNLITCSFSCSLAT